MSALTAREAVYLGRRSMVYKGCGGALDARVLRSLARSTHLRSLELFKLQRAALFRLSGRGRAPPPEGAGAIYRRPRLRPVIPGTPGLCRRPCCSRGARARCARPTAPSRARGGRTARASGSPCRLWALLLLRRTALTASRLWVRRVELVPGLGRVLF